MERNREQCLSEIEVRLRDLLISACAGCEADYLIFLKEITLHLRGYFRKRLPAFYEDVEDLVQETLVAVHSNRHTYKTSQPLTAWMYAIARYKMIDWLRDRSSRASAISIPIDEALEILDESDSLATDAKIDIEGILAELPERYRLPITYVKLQGLSVAETARLTGMTESCSQGWHPPRHESTPSCD